MKFYLKYVHMQAPEPVFAHLLLAFSIMLLCSCLLICCLSLLITILEMTVYFIFIIVFVFILICPGNAQTNAFSYHMLVKTKPAFTHYLS